jgi:hypothetical protein
MFAHQPSVGQKEKDRTIERPAVTFDDTDDQEDPAIACSLSQGVTSWTGYVHSAFVIAPEIISPLGGSKANPGTEVQTCGITGYKRFREDNQFRSFLSRPAY